jgi:predicted NUDIX family NTP pyrophosphohydrolase
MAAVSAGLLMCRDRGDLHFFLVHPGGPYFKNKNEGVWTIPKGLVDEDEDRLVAAQREFLEETGMEPRGFFYPLGSTRMKSGKEIFAWAFAGDWNEADGITSNTFELEWPPRSGKIAMVPEADQGRWMVYEEAVVLIHPAQRVFLDRAMAARELILSGP